MPDMFQEVIVAQRMELLLKLINKAGCDNEKEMALAFEWLFELMVDHTESLAYKEVHSSVAGT
ncbi:hypothetical protein [Pantoea sp. FN0307]|uniref:hypothetical protein n=1 Tax=unclassified Pantoea TaxID=2630326 RepID=UPI003CE9FF94